MRLIALSTVALIAATAPALAAGPTQVVPVAPVAAPVAVAPDHDWTGGSVGLQFGTLDADTSGAASLSGDDTLLGLRAYYDMDMGDWVVGGGLQFDSTDVVLADGIAIDEVLRLGGRVGYDLGRAWVYGTGGYARVDTTSAAVGSSDGYFAGIGAETLLTDNLSLGGELLYHEFSDFDLSGLDADATTFAVSVNFRF